MARASSTSTSRTLPKPAQRGRPPRALQLVPVLLTNANGEPIREKLGDEWIQFLTSTVQRLLDNGTLVVQDHVITVNPRKASL